MIIFISITPASMTKYVKKSELQNDWYEIDAKGVVVGRLATIISKIIRGKKINNLYSTYG